MSKLKVAILGTGNIGTDLLVKITKSEYLSCTMFTGRNLNSVGMRRAKSLGIAISDQGINEIVNDPSICDVVVDCTSAQAHHDHWPICHSLGKTVIDLTPAKLGSFCVPAVANESWNDNETKNINMITCGGQTSIPIAFALSRVHKDIEYIEVVSNKLFKE